MGFAGDPSTSHMECSVCYLQSDTLEPYPLFTKFLSQGVRIACIEWNGLHTVSLCQKCLTDFSCREGVGFWKGLLHGDQLLPERQTIHVIAYGGGSGQAESHGKRGLQLNNNFMMPSCSSIIIIRN